MKASTPELMKFQKLQRRLKESRRGIIGLLEGLWIAVAKNCPRGNIGRFSNEEIAIMVDWENDADELVAALVDCGWLDHCEAERLVVHDWQDHCPTYVKGGLSTKGQDIAIAVTSSHRLKPQAIAIGSEPVSTYSSLACSSQAKPIQDSSSEPSQASESVDSSIAFECIGKDAGWWNPPLKLIADLKSWYPSHDITAELRKAAGWHATNPAKRKTKKGMPAFLNGWMQKAKPSAAPNSPPRDPSKPLIAGSLKPGDPGYDSPEYKKLLIQHAREVEARRLADAKRIPD